LTEGVVAVGVIPQAGLTEGTVVTAPAHVEFETADVGASLRIDRTPTSVRAPVPLEGHHIGEGAVGPRGWAHDGSAQLEKPSSARRRGARRPCAWSPSLRGKTRKKEASKHELTFLYEPRRLFAARMSSIRATGLRSPDGAASASVRKMIRALLIDDDDELAR